MKRKKPTRNDPVVAEEILTGAKNSVMTDRANPARIKKCGVCGDEVAPNSTEDLCWVCRRLKISAWRESDQQMPATE